MSQSSPESSPTKSQNLTKPIDIGHVNQLYRDLKLAVETLPIERILGYASNPHVHPDPQISVLERSLGTFGCVAPIITDEKNVIVAGHGVLLAAKK